MSRKGEFLERKQIKRIRDVAEKLVEKWLVEKQQVETPEFRKRRDMERRKSVTYEGNIQIQDWSSGTGS